LGQELGELSSTGGCPLEISNVRIGDNCCGGGSLHEHNFTPRVSVGKRLEALFGFVGTMTCCRSGIVRDFAAEYLALLRGGLSHPEAIGVLTKTTQSASLRKALGHVQAAIQEGQHLPDAFATQPKFFNKVFVNLLKVGEASGRYHDMLHYITVNRAAQRGGDPRASLSLAGFAYLLGMLEENGKISHHGFALAAACTSGRLGKCLQKAAKEMNCGESFENAIAEEKKVFDPLFRAMLHEGEGRGCLGRMMREYAWRRKEGIWSPMKTSSRG
jgi:type II secretory pathway component PulF